LTSKCASPQLLLSLPFAPIAPLSGRLCARPVGGGPVRRLLCLPLSSSCGVARWQGDVVDRFSFGKKIRRPISLQDVYMRAFM